MSKNIVLGVIPARYNSTRFLGKPLVDINGMSMIERVYKQCLKAQLLNDVCVATDDNRIFEHVVSFGGKVIMTSDLHESGTDRCLEAARTYAATYKELKPNIVVNIQGDEPLINPENINLIINSFSTKKTAIATLATPFKNNEQIENHNNVKVAISKNNFALYFSRAVIPYVRNSKSENLTNEFCYLKHLGIYAFKFNVLIQICNLPQSKLEITEKLEQLRWLENDYKIKVLITDTDSISVDTPSDLELVKQKIIFDKTY